MILIIIITIMLIKMRIMLIMIVIIVVRIVVMIRIIRFASPLGSDAVDPEPNGSVAREAFPLLPSRIRSAPP